MLIRYEEFIKQNQKIKFYNLDKEGIFEGTIERENDGTINYNIKMIEESLKCLLLQKDLN